MNNRMTSFIVVNLLVIGGFIGFVNFEGEYSQGTLVSGSIAVDTIWDLVGSPYIVMGDVWVEIGVSLTIEPGVNVKFNGFYSIFVNGTFIAVGTETDRINITSNMIPPKPGDWDRIQISSMGATEHAEIKYCNINYGVRGVHIESSGNIIGYNLISSIWNYGLYIYSSSNNIITNNNISSNNDYGIYVDLSNNNIVLNNTVSSNNFGIHLESAYSNMVMNNDIYLNNEMGISLWSSPNNDIINNNISNNGDSGIYIETFSDNNIISNNNITDNDKGIFQFSTKNNDITGNNVSLNNYIGLQLVGSSASNISDNIIYSNNIDGILLKESTNNNLSNNIISSNNNHGIYLWVSSDNNLSNNTISSNYYYGIYLQDSSNNNLFNNIFENDGVLIEGNIPKHFNSHIIPDNNLINSNPLYYYKNYSDMNLDGITVGELILVNCTNVNITHLQISDTDVGIEMAYSANILIAHNNISSNDWYDFYVYLSSNNNITSNNISKNKYCGISLISSSNNNITKNNLSLIDFYGINLDSSSNNSITGNYLSDNLDGIRLRSSSDNYIMYNYLSNNFYGIYIYLSSINSITTNRLSDNLYGIQHVSSSNNSITDNNVSNSKYAIRLFFSSNTNITDNTISFNSNYGIYLGSSSNNRIYRNNIIGNINQAYDDRNDNYWDNGYPEGGNYWSDFDEPGEGAFDDFNGSDQNVLGSDGIVDLGLPSGGKNPYVIDSDSQDNYPLINFKLGLFLYPGWNLISIPYVQFETNLNLVLSAITRSYDIVQWYNASDKIDYWKVNNTSKLPHLNDLNSIDHKMGFWIHITEPGGILFEYSGTQPTSNQTIPLHPGWNLVGYPSLSIQNRTEGLNNLKFGMDVDCIQWYNTAKMTWHFMGPDDYFVPGRGYWIHSKVEAIWEVPM